MASLRKLLPAALVVLAATGCSDRDVAPMTPQPEPEPGFRLTGYVLLNAVLTEETTKNGAEIVRGLRAVRNATGFRVRLQRPDGSVDSTLTAGGRFVFHAEAPGLYRASCWVSATDTVATTDVVLAGADVVFPDTLEVSRSPGLSTYPNPFGASGMGMEGETVTPQRLQFHILRLDGTPVWSTSYEWPGCACPFHTHWVPVDDAGAPVPHGLYWAVVDRDGARYHSLVFHE